MTVTNGAAQRIAIFGGVYSNYHALLAVLADARRRGAEQIYCLGDLGAFGPFPDRIFPVLLDHGVRTVQGNYDHSLGNRREDCACGYTDPRDNHFARLSYEYTFRNTSDEWKDWLRELPRELRVVVGDREVLLCHGSPRRTNEFLWESTSPDPFLRRLFLDQARESQFPERQPSERLAPPLGAIACTHSGLHWQRAIDDGLVVNVGVIGRPENNGTTAVGYVLLAGDSTQPSGLAASYHDVDYDHAALADEMRGEGLPAEFVETIETGWWTSCLEIMPAKERACGRY